MWIHSPSSSVRGIVAVTAGSAAGGMHMLVWEKRDVGVEGLAKASCIMQRKPKFKFA